MKLKPVPRHALFIIICMAIAVTGGCSALLPKPAAPPAFYTLDLAQPAPLAAARPRLPPPDAPTLVVTPPHAAAGFDSNRIVYTHEAHQLEYFAKSEWIDTPARMLAPLIVSTLANGGSFRAVLATPSAAAGDIKLDTEVVRLQQDFAVHPSRVRFTLRAAFVENKTRRVLAWREFDESVAAATEDPAGGVDAANSAVQRVLQALAALCMEAVANWSPTGAESTRP